MMRVFISWSGEKSRRIAMVFKDWLPTVVQNLHPYVSSEDIGKGTPWSRELQSELEASEFGLLCVTRENVEAPWMLYEAGALSKVGISRVSPFLFDLQPPELTGPLQLFQSTLFDKWDIRKLVSELNKASGRQPEKQLEQVFERWYPDLERRLNALRAFPDDRPEGQSARIAADLAALRRLAEETGAAQRRLLEENAAAASRLMQSNAMLQRGLDGLNRRTGALLDDGLPSRTAELLEELVDLTRQGTPSDRAEAERKLETLEREVASLKARLGGEAP